MLKSVVEPFGFAPSSGSSGQEMPRFQASPFEQILATSSVGSVPGFAAAPGPEVLRFSFSVLTLQYLTHAL